MASSFYCRAAGAFETSAGQNHQPGVPPSPLFSKISGISGLAGDPGVKILIPEILEAKY